MARKNKKKKSLLKRYASNKLFWVVIIVIIGLISFGAFHHKMTAKTVVQKTTTTSSNQPKSNVGGAAYSTTPLNATSTNAPNNTRKTTSTTTPASSTLDTSTANPSIGIIITRIATNPAAVFTQVSGATSGTCSLKATQPGQATVAASAQVIQNVNSYECGSFNLASNQFANGTWTVYVTLTSGDSSVTSEPLSTTP